MKVKVGFRIRPELLCEIDRLRGLVKRSQFVEHLLRLGLEAYLRDEEAYVSLGDGGGGKGAV